MEIKKNSRHTTALFGGFALVLVSCGALADGSGNWRDGKEVYDKACGYCHEKGIGPEIKGLGRLPADVRKAVRAGKNAMPAFRATEIDDASLAKVAEYIK